MNTNAKIHFYFDWNVFKYIKTPRNENDKAFSRLIYSLKDYIFIAYSPFHISGLLKNYDESKYNFIEKDCELITELTNNLCISKNNNEIILDYRDPLQMFKDQLETELMTKKMTESDNLYDIMTPDKKKEFEQNYQKIKKDESLKDIDDPFLNAIKMSGSAKEAFMKIVKKQNDIQREPDIYIKLRSNILKNNDKYDELSESEKENINNKLKEIGIEKDYSELNETDFIEIAKSNFVNYIDTDVSNLYTLKDLFGLTKPEKITKKNTFKNILDDSFHLDFAQYALYYISDDKANLEKARIIKNQIDLQMEIFDIENAIKSIGVSLFTKNNQNSDKEKAIK